MYQKDKAWLIQGVTSPFRIIIVLDHLQIMVECFVHLPMFVGLLPINGWSIYSPQHLIHCGLLFAIYKNECHAPSAHNNNTYKTI